MSMMKNLFKKSEEVQKKKGEIEQVADNFSALFNESEVHKEIVCNAIRDLISANQKMDIEIETIEMLMESLATLKVEYIELKEHNRDLLKKLMPIMKDEVK